MDNKQTELEQVKETALSGGYGKMMQEIAKRIFSDTTSAEGRKTLTESFILIADNLTIITHIIAKYEQNVN